MSHIPSSGATPASIYHAYEANSYLFGGNAPYVEEMYENYLANPCSVPDSWRGQDEPLVYVSFGTEVPSPARSYFPGLYRDVLAALETAVVPNVDGAVRNP